MENSILSESIYDMSFMVKAKRRSHKKFSKKLYILLTNTDTVIGNAILKVTGADYNHASLSLTKHCTHVYGFGRNTEKDESGFIKEDLTSGIYKQNEVSYKLLEFSVTEEEHRKVVEILRKFELNKDLFKFDKLGLALAALNIPHNKQNMFFCSGFIQFVLLNAGICLFDKNYALVKPNDFNLHPDLKEVGKGKIKDLVKKYNKEIMETNDDSLIHESKLTYKERQNLSKDDFGIPELKKYPIPDEDHVKDAIKFFNYVDSEHEQELADNINRKIKEFKMKDIHIGKNNRFKEYYNEGMNNMELIITEEENGGDNNE